MDSWLLLVDGTADAALNMAIDEALLRTAAARGRPLLRVYGWAEPSISIGCFQKYPSRLAARHAIVRRPTGGGLVYHDRDTTYTVVVPPGHRLYRLRTSEAYCELHRAVAAALGPDSVLASAPAVARPNQECFENPVPGDVVAAGRKRAGAAQRRTRAGMLHQGSIAAAVPAERLQEAFTRELAARFEPYALGDRERALAKQLEREKYATRAWNQKLV